MAQTFCWRCAGPCGLASSRVSEASAAGLESLLVQFDATLIIVPPRSRSYEVFQSTYRLVPQ